MIMARLAGYRIRLITHSNLLYSSFVRFPVLYYAALLRERAKEYFSSSVLSLILSR
jgi:hypothetical protein